MATFFERFTASLNDRPGSIEFLSDELYSDITFSPQMYEYPPTSIEGSVLIVPATSEEKLVQALSYHSIQLETSASAPGKVPDSGQDMPENHVLLQRCLHLQARVHRIF